MLSPPAQTGLLRHEAWLLVMKFRVRKQVGVQAPHQNNEFRLCDCQF